MRNMGGRDIVEVEFQLCPGTPFICRQIRPKEARPARISRSFRVE